MFKKKIFWFKILFTYQRFMALPLYRKPKRTGIYVCVFHYHFLKKIFKKERFKCSPSPAWAQSHNSEIKSCMSTDWASQVPPSTTFFPEPWAMPGTKRVIQNMHGMIVSYQRQLYSRCWDTMGSKTKHNLALREFTWRQFNGDWS